MLMRAPAPRRRAAPIHGMLTISAATLGATLVVAATAGGTYGLWNDSAPISAGVVKSGSLTLLVNDGPSAALDPALWGALFPGDRVHQSVMLTNDGTVAADVTVAVSSTSAAASDYTVEVVRDACPVSPADLSAANSLAGPAAVGVWFAGQSLEACIEVTLNEAASPASQGTAIPLTFVFTATQQVASA